MTEKIIEAIVYTKDYCPYCDTAKNILNRYNVISCVEQNIQTNSSYMEEMKQRFQNLEIDLPRTVPQIFINNKYIGGCDDLQNLVKNSDWIKSYL